MRMSASIYDNLRQPGVYDALDRATCGDDRAMGRAVLARLRLDDLLTNDSLGEESRIVWSISDTLDGRLFTLVPPTQLTGINFEIICHPNIAIADPATVVPMALASWIHDDQGKGRPGGFLAVGEGLHRHVTQELQQMSDLNVTSLKTAREVARNAGIPPAELDKLVELWERWDSAIRNKQVILRPWGRAASGAPLLRRFLEDQETNGAIPQFGLTEQGTHIFREALVRLERSRGRRDSPVRFLLDQIEANRGTDKDEACVVHQLFMHYTFLAIARSNRATPEFTVTIGECDRALTGEDLDRIEAIVGKREPVNIDPRIASGLGHLDASEYKKVKDASAPRVRAGIEEFIQSRGSSLAKLQDAMCFLAKAIGETAVDAEGGLFRTVSIGGLGSALGAAGGLALDFLLGGSQPMVSAVGGGAIGGSVGAAVDSAHKNRNAHRNSELLKKSLIRTFENELKDRK